MQWQFTPYVLPLLLSATGSLALALFAWQHRQLAGTTSFIWLMLVIAVWSFGNVLELGSVDLATKLFWANAEYFGIAFTPLAWFAFAAEYAGHAKWLTPRTYAALTLIPLLTIFFVWTNDWHGLMRTNIRLDASGPFLAIAKTYGPWFWVHTLYSYALNLLSAVLLIQTIIPRSVLGRGRAVALLVSVVVPWIGNLAYVFRTSPIPSLDLTPVGFAFSGLALAWAIFRSGLLNIVPAARGTIIATMSDGVIVFDAQDHVVDINRAALQIMGHSALDAIGQTSEQIFSTHPDLAERYRRTTEAYEEIVRGEGAARRAWDVQTVPVLDQHHQRVGQLMTLRDITDQKRAEQTRQENVTLEQFRTVVANSPDAVLILDLTARKVMFLNRDEFCGYAKSELETPELILRAIHPDDLQLLKAYWLQYSAGRVDKTDTIECRLKKKDGEWEWIQGRATTLERQPQGAPKQILFTLTTITERKQTEEKLVYLSTHDALTGLYNRAFFEEEMERIRRGRQFPVSILMADVNELKRTNDNWGHAAGDESLRRAAQALKAVFRAEDPVARIGGDEFAVLLVNTDAAVAVALPRIRNNLVRLNALQGGASVSLALGAGTALQGNALANAFKEADAMMYVDKAFYRQHPF